MTTQLWFYLDGQEQKGPFGIEALRQMLQAGVIKPETWVARQGEANWAPAATLLSPGQQSVSSAPAQSHTSEPSPAGFIVIILVILLIGVGFYAANPHLLIVALIAGACRALWNKFTGNKP